MKKNNKMRSLLAIVLCLCMVIGVVRGIAPFAEETASARTPGIVSIAADPDTTDTYVNKLISDKWGGRYAGRTWADKSVFANQGSGASLVLDNETDGIAGTVSTDADFLHVFSALGSTQVMDEETPLDVMFVVDISESMSYYNKDPADAQDTSPIYRTVRALNAAINQLLEASPNSRFGVTVYSSKAVVLLPLGQYEKNGDSAFLSLAETQTGRQSMYFTVTVVAREIESGNVITSVATNDTEEEEKKKSAWEGIPGDGSAANPFVINGGMTNIQSGIAAGLGCLAEAEDTIYISETTGNRQSRIPVMLLMSDGATNTMADVVCDAADQSKAELNWYNPSLTKDFAHRNEYDNSSIVDLVQSADDYYELDDKAPYSLATLMTASYYSASVTKHYQKVAESEGLFNVDSVKLQNYSVFASSTGNASSDSDRNVTNRIMDPAEYFTGSAVTAGGDAYSMFTEWCGEAKESKREYHTYYFDNTGIHRWDFTLSLSQDQLEKGKYAKDFDVSVDDIKNNIFYVPKGNAKFATFNDIEEVFKEIIASLTSTAFGPVSGENDAGVEDSLTYTDPIGKYMEVKKDAVSAGGNADDMAFLLFGKMHTITRTAIYDYAFNDAYQTRIGKQYGTFQSGWYSSDDPQTATYQGPAESDGDWNDGNVYYVDYTTAIDFVPTLKEVVGGVENLSEKQKHTAYTLYRFTENQATRRTWYLNPSYEGRVSEFEAGRDYYTKDTGSYKAYQLVNQDIDESSAPAGVYRLSDIRIWVEDTGDWIDDSGTLLADTGFDQALYVNIPAGVLPMQIVDISVSSDGVESYETNLDEKEESTPLRLFYSVGLQSELLSEDGSGVDFTKLSQEYINAHKNNRGNIEFLSNYYSDTRYNGYVTEEFARTQGDPVMTFSPRQDNRYYVFQKPLSLYKKAYQWSDADKAFTVLADDADWEGHDLLGIYASMPSPGTDGKIGSGKDAVTPRDGDVILLEEDCIALPAEGATADFDPDSFYYIVIEYYVPATQKAAGQGRSVQYVVNRKGVEFVGTGYDGIDVGDMLCWYDANGNHGVATGAEARKLTDGKWVLSTRPGGLRVSNMVRNVGMKGDVTGQNYTDGNVTGTANNYYLPTLSSSTGTGDKMLVNLYLGNNGKLLVPDTLLLVTKKVTVKDAQLDEDPREKEFQYQAYIEDFSGVHSAVKVEWDEAARLWRRRISTIDVLTNNDGLLQSAGGSALAVVDADGKYVADPASGEANYYVYVKDEGEGDGDDTSTDQVVRVYSAEDNSEGSAPSGSIKRYTEADSSGHKAGDVDFLANTVYLIPVGEYGDGWTFDEGAGSYIELSNFLTATMSIERDNGLGSSIDLDSRYEIRSQLLTVPVEFGLHDDLYDARDVTINGRKVSASELAAHTAQFTLKHNEGLLFSGIHAGGDYRVTEMLPDADIGKGYGLSDVGHVQQSGEENVYEEDVEGTDGSVKAKTIQGPGGTADFTKNDSGKVYSVFGSTAASAQEDAVQYTNKVAEGCITVKKTLKADEFTSINDKDKARAFDFTIKLNARLENGESGAPLAGPFDYYINGADGKKTCEGRLLAYGEPGGNDADISAAFEGTWNFKLKDGEELVVLKLPVEAGYTYHVSENEAEYYTPDADSGKSGNQSEVEGSVQPASRKDPVVLVSNTKAAPEAAGVVKNTSKEITGNNAREPEAGEFEFEITPDQDNPLTDPLNKTAKRVTNDKDGNIPLFDGTEEFKEAGIYRYTVREVIPQDIPAGMTYDQRHYTATVTVVEDYGENDDTYAGKLKAAVELTGEEEGAGFTNILEANVGVVLQAHKTLKGAKPLAEGEFSFTLKGISADYAEEVGMDGASVEESDSEKIPVPQPESEKKKETEAPPVKEPETKASSETEPATEPETKASQKTEPATEQTQTPMTEPMTEQSVSSGDSKLMGSESAKEGAPMEAQTVETQTVEAQETQPPESETVQPPESETAPPETETVQTESETVQPSEQETVQPPESETVQTPESNVAQTEKPGVNQDNKAGEPQSGGQGSAKKGKEDALAGLIKDVISVVSSTKEAAEEELPPMPKETTAKNAADGIINFGQITYTKPGTYVYEIAEVNDGKRGCTYDSTVFTATVKVEWNEDKSALKASVEYSGENSEKTAEFVNVVSVGGLSVKKTVTGSGGDKNKNFQFTVTLSDEKDSPLTDIDGMYGNMEFKKGVATFTLKHGESRTAQALPAGVSYTVKEAEANQDGYTTTITGGSGKIEDGQVAMVEVKNDRTATGNLTVSKTVTGNKGNKNTKFHFTVTLSDKNLNGVYGEMNFMSGVATFTLKHGENKKATNLPEGVTYKVDETEADKDGYDTTSTGAEGQIKAETDAKASFVNDKDGDKSNKKNKSNKNKSNKNKSNKNKNSSKLPGSSDGSSSEAPGGSTVSVSGGKGVYNAPNTDDGNRIAWWIALMTASGLGAAFCLVRTRKRRS